MGRFADWECGKLSHLRNPREPLHWGPLRMAQDTPAQPDRWYLDAAPSTVSAWLTRLQWTRCGVDGAVVLTSLLLSTADFPLRRLAPVIAATALIYGDIALRRGRGQAVPRAEAGLAVALDVLLLTGLLELTGGPSNPFSVIYAVPVLLAGITLGSLWAWLIAAVAVAAYGVLITWHLEELVPSHHRLIDFPTHLFTMWLAIALLGEALAHVIREASAAIARREGQLEVMRKQGARQERLMSLTTLAAGAAHELSTPLGTIAVASRELERALSGAQANAACAADARLIRDQVARCHTILDQMSGRAGGNSAEAAEHTDIATLFAEVQKQLPPEQAERMLIRVGASLPPILVPRAGLIQVLISLVKNAFASTEGTRPVSIEGVREGQLVRLIVRDEGTGMSPEALTRAGEPFYTTKDPGRGFGLGLFLAKMFAERCGGTLTLQSDRGTTATLELPLSSDTSEAA